MWHSPIPNQFWKARRGAEGGVGGGRGVKTQKKQAMVCTRKSKQGSHMLLRGLTTAAGAGTAQARIPRHQPQLLQRLTCVQGSPPARQACLPCEMTFGTLLHDAFQASSTLAAGGGSRARALLGVQPWGEG